MMATQSTCKQFALDQIAIALSDSLNVRYGSD
jgi:hypothetical protein